MSNYHIKHLEEYYQVYRKSIREPENFWEEIAEEHFVWRKKWNKVLEWDFTKPEIKWFEGAKLNYAENLLQRRDDKTAIIFRGEAEIKRQLSYKELFAEVEKTAAGLGELGVVKGDGIAGFMPNMPESIIAMLATASIGAIWSSSSPDFGIKGVLDRFTQIEPKVIFAADGQMIIEENYKSVLDSLISNKIIKPIIPNKPCSSINRPTSL